MLNPDVRGVLDGTSIAHIASVLPDGAPHSVPVWIGAQGGPRRDPDRAGKPQGEKPAPRPSGCERVVLVIEPVGVG